MLMMQAPRSWLGQMLTQWLEWAPGDGHGSTGFATKKALRMHGTLEDQSRTTSSTVSVNIYQCFIHYLIIYFVPHQSSQSPIISLAALHSYSIANHSNTYYSACMRKGQSCRFNSTG